MQHGQVSARMPGMRIPVLLVLIGSLAVPMPAAQAQSVAQQTETPAPRPATPMPLPRPPRDCTPPAPPTS